MILNGGITGRVALSWLLAGVLLVLSGLVNAADIQSVRLGRAPDNTRLVFDLSGPADHSLFTLFGPVPHRCRRPRAEVVVWEVSAKF